jgi:hypothetical protein
MFGLAAELLLKAARTGRWLILTRLPRKWSGRCVGMGGCDATRERRPWLRAARNLSPQVTVCHSQSF